MPATALMVGWHGGVGSLQEEVDETEGVGHQSGKREKTPRRTQNATMPRLHGRLRALRKFPVDLDLFRVAGILELHDARTFFIMPRDGQKIRAPPQSN
jgi:hypothetical protein